MNIKNIIIFRHGETNWNKEKRYQGHIDIPLNELGKEQAHSLGPKLLQYNPQLILTSDLLRAKETALIVNSYLNIPTIESKELRECSLGDADGMIRDNIKKVYGDHQWRTWLSINKEDQDFSFPNGESKNNHYARMNYFLQEFCKTQTQYKTILVSTHGGSLRRLVHNCLNSPIDPIPIPNCAHYHLTLDISNSIWKFIK